MKLLLYLCFALSAAAGDSLAPKPLTEIQRLQWENAVLRQNLAQAAAEQAKQQLERVAQEGGAVYTAICKAHGIEAKDLEALSEVCLVDGKTVTRKAPPEKK